MRIVLSASVLLSLVTVGCGDGDMMGGDGSMADHAALFEGHADDYRLALDEHATAIGIAGDLDRMRELEAEHAVRAAEHMGAMRHEMGDMMGCMGGDGPGNGVGMMMDDLDAMHAEADRHRQAMGNAADVSVARTEESRHQGAMGEVMANMWGRMDAMMGGGSMHCGHHGMMR